MIQRVFIWLTAFVFLTSALHAKGKEEKDTAFMSLYQRYFQLYGTDKEKEFFEASEQMKAYYLKNGKKDSYYKIRQNEVLYDTENGKIYRAIKRANEILEEMKKEGVKHYEIVYTALATIYESRGNYRMADYYYKDALKNALPTDSGALISIYSRIASLKACRDPQEAWTYNEKFGSLSRNFPAYYKVYLALKGEINFFKGNKEGFMEADKEFNQMIADNPDMDNYGVSMMNILRHAFTGHYEEALKLIREEDPDRRDLGRLDIMGRIYEMMGRLDLSLKVSARRRDLRDSLNSDLLFDNLNEVNAEMGLVRLSEKAAKDHEEMIRQAAKEREMWFIVTIVLLLMGIGLIVWRYLTRRRYQKRLVKKNKELEVALDRAQESDRMKTSFIEHVSHEIRTPLNVITGFAQVITNPLYELEEEERNTMLNDISRNTIEITNIVNELLELAQDESKQYYEKEDDVVVNALCQQAVNNMSVINNGRLDLRFKSMLDDDFTLHSNAKAIEKILEQLLKNALKFTPEGSIELKVRERAANGGVEFTITDTGIGVPEEFHEKIFERFYKVDNFKQGLGLGLTMSRKIAELLEGSLDIDKTYTKGARFVLILPQS